MTEWTLDIKNLKAGDGEHFAQWTTVKAGPSADSCKDKARDLARWTPSLAFRLYDPTGILHAVCIPGTRARARLRWETDCAHKPRETLPR